MVRKKQATINFRGKSVKLQYTLAANILLEDHGIDMSKPLEFEGTVKEIVTFVLAGLITDYPDATFEEVSTAFKMRDMKGLSAAIAAGVTDSN